MLNIQMSSSNRTGSSELHAELRDLGSRDLQLWSIGLLVLIVVALGFLVLVAPNLLWKSTPLKIEIRFLPQLFTGFIILVILFNVYLLDQKRRLNSMRDSLVRRLLLNDYGEKSASRDHLTNAFNREYALFAIDRERQRVDKAPFTVLMVDVADFRKTNHRFGNLAGDHLLLVASQLIRSTFRGSDIVCRFGGDEFVVVMPETTPDQTASPIGRLIHAAQLWNQTTELNYSLGFRCALVDGSASANTHEMLENLFAQTRGDRTVPLLSAFQPQPVTLRA
jgi:diguanylate cyclase (GGDEF)-like protein